MNVWLNAFYSSAVSGNALQQSNSGGWNNHLHHTNGEWTKRTKPNIPQRVTFELHFTTDWQKQIKSRKRYRSELCTENRSSFFHDGIVRKYIPSLFLYSFHLSLTRYTQWLCHSQMLILRLLAERGLFFRLTDENFAQVPCVLLNVKRAYVSAQSPKCRCFLPPRPCTRGWWSTLPRSLSIRVSHAPKGRFNIDQKHH